VTWCQISHLEAAEVRFTDATWPDGFDAEVDATERTNAPNRRGR
jgi:hypothetical protein